MKNNLHFLFLPLYFIAIGSTINGQSISINHDQSPPNPFAILDINAQDMGILIPRMTTEQRNKFALSLGEIETGMLVFDSDENQFYFWQDPIFRRISHSTGIIDDDLDTEIRVEENPDDDIIRFYAEGSERWTMESNRIEPQNDQGLIFIGKSAGINNASRTNNIAIGDSSLLRNGIGASGVREGNDNIGIGKKTLENNSIGAQNLAIGSFSLHNNLGNSNTALGNNTLNSNTEGDANTAVGHNALELNRTGENNVGIGINTLQQNSSGSNNIAIGSNSLSTNASASNSIAIGTDASRGNSVSGTIAIGDSTLMVNGTGSTFSYDGAWQTAIGHQVLRNNTTGSSNTGVGFRTLTENTIGRKNTALGAYALRSNISGIQNIAIGTSTLSSNTVGNDNTAVGQGALVSNEDGDRNVGIGQHALLYSRTGNRNVALGSQALLYNRTGDGNVAIGDAALFNSETSIGIVAIGDSVLYDFTGNINNWTEQVAIGNQSQRWNSSGYRNTSVGSLTLYTNRSGDGNTALGASAAGFSTGDHNTALGNYAMVFTETGDENTAVGAWTLAGNTSRNRRTAIGYSANSLGNNGNNTGLGNDADCTAAHQVRIGNDAVTSIGGYANWTNISNGDFKKDVQENVVGLAFIDQLRPVTYKLDLEAVHDFYRVNYREDKQKRYEEQSAAGTMVRSGFIAQEVEALAKKLGYDFSGVDAPKNKKDYYGLRYAAFVVPLVKAVQEQQEIIDAQEARLSNLEGKLRQMEKLFYAEIEVVKESN